MLSPSQKTIDTILAHFERGIENRKIRIEIFKQFEPDWYVTFTGTQHPDIRSENNPPGRRIGFWRINKGILMIESDNKGEYDPKMAEFLSFNTTVAISETLNRSIRDLDRLVIDPIVTG